MDIRQRVLASAKTSFAKYGFKKSELEQLVGIIAGNLTDESTDEDIANALSASEGYAQMMQSVYNRGVSETSEKYKDYVPKPAEPAPAPAPEPAPKKEPETLTLESVKEMIKKANANKQAEIDEAVKKAVAPLLERERSAHLRSLLQTHDRLKTIPEVFRNNYTLDKEENLETLASKIESDWASTKQALVASGQFVEAPSKSDPQSEVDDFVKTMQGFAERNKPKEQ